MATSYRETAHGSFAFDFRSDLTLISIAGAWNDRCGQVYFDVLHSRTVGREFGRRAVMIDARNWELVTPDVGEIFRRTNELIAKHYEVMHIAYVVDSRLQNVAEHVLGEACVGFEDKVIWRRIADIESGIAWLQSNDYAIQDLDESDFPQPVAAESWIKWLEGPDLETSG